MAASGTPMETLDEDAGSAFKPVFSADIKTLLKQQQEALKWTLALNQAIKCWTEEHAPAVAQTPSSANGASPKKWIQFEDCVDPNQSEDCMSDASVRNRSRPDPATWSRKRTVSAVDDFAKLWSSFSPPSSCPVSGRVLSPTSGDFLKPLLADASPTSGERKGSKASLSAVASDVSDNSPTRKGHHKHQIARSTRVDQLLFPSADRATLFATGILNKPVETIEDHYKKTGFCVRCVKSSDLFAYKFFNNITLLIILFNTIWIAYDTDNNHAEILCDAHPVFQVADNFFCTFFCFELFVRLNAYYDWSALKDPWYMFDAVLVSLMVWETWIQVLLYLTVGSASFQYGRLATILRICRLARLTRVARTGKLLRSVPELMILAKAMVLALRSVAAVLVMLMLVIYVFGVLFTQLLSGTTLAAEHFGTVPRSMNFLLMQLLIGFDFSLLERLVLQGTVYYLIFLVFLLIANMTIMNMLIGILCDVVSGVSDQSKEEIFEKELERHLEALSAKIDPDGDGQISRGEFENLMSDVELVEGLDRAGVDVVSFCEYASYVLQEDNSTVTSEDFMRLLVQFRGDRVATVKELVSTRRYMTKLFEAMEVRVPHEHVPTGPF